MIQKKNSLIPVVHFNYLQNVHSPLSDYLWRLIDNGGTVVRKDTIPAISYNQLSKALKHFTHDSCHIVEPLGVPPHLQTIADTILPQVNLRQVGCINTPHHLSDDIGIFHETMIARTQGKDFTEELMCLVKFDRGQEKVFGHPILYGRQSVTPEEKILVDALLEMDQEIVVEACLYFPHQLFRR